MSIITLADARQQLNYDPDDVSDDDEIQTYVDAITAAIEDYKGEIIESQSITEELELPGWWKFYLNNVPILSLTSITALDAWSFAPTLSLLHVTPTSGRVRVLPGGFPPRGFVSVTYQAGYTVVPPRFKKGALVLLQYLWEAQRGVGLGASGVVGQEELHERGLGGAATSYIIRKGTVWFGPPRPVVSNA